MDIFAATTIHVVCGTLNITVPLYKYNVHQYDNFLTSLTLQLSVINRSSRFPEIQELSSIQSFPAH